MTDLQRLCERERVSIVSRPAEPPKDGDWQPGSAHWRCTLRYKGRQLTTEFHQGPAICAEPTPADVLSSLILDADCGSQTFEDFCADLGYDPDSRKAERIWKACAAMAPKVERFLGNMLETFRAAEH